MSHQHWIAWAPVNRDLRLASGAVISRPFDLLRAFFAEEWAYYDGIADPSPSHIVPLDVVVTVSVNSFLNSASRIRSVHRGLAEVCDPLLAEISDDADLRSVASGPVVELLDAACQVKWVLVPVAAKVLHRKRPSLIPMLDTVVSDYYLRTAGRLDLRAAREDKRRAAATAQVPLDAFRHDLEDAWRRLGELRSALAGEGWPVAELRILEVMIWMWADPLRQYVQLFDDDRDTV